ncbi:MAG: hypothetical protein LBS43_07295 [Prevotellaceae bacterium]|jgi:hypothetical protein|nr:hypothetical protein [Prevotellaceae bacterium]
MKQRFRFFLTVIFFLFSVYSVECQDLGRLRRDQSFLGIHFDFHAGADCKEIGKNTTPEMINAIIDMVHPDYIQIDCKGHAGYSSYPTKVGNQAPGFVGDPLRIWREVTAKRGVALYMHYSGVWDNRAIELHPEWAVIDADGTRNGQKTSVFGQYADKLLIPQLKELAGDYGVDGAWVDGECWATVPDYGDRAVRMFKETTVINSIPKSSKDPHWHEWIQFHRESFRKYLRHYVAAVKSEYPEFQLCSNWAFTHQMSEPVSVALDFLSGDYSANNSVNSARYAGRYLVHQGIPWDLMAWSFPYDFSSNPPPKVQKPAVQLKREAAIVLALGGGFQAYYTQNRDGSVRLDEMMVMAEVAKFARARQPYCHHSAPVPQVALLISTTDYQINAQGVFPLYKGHAQGTLQCLLEGQHSVDIVNEETLAPDMSRFPLIIIPEWKNISPAFRVDLIDYVEAGGSLLVIGKETSDQFAELAGVTLSDDKPVTQSFGSGKIGFLPFPAGEKYEKNGDKSLHKLMNETVRSLFPNPLVEVSGSQWVDVSVSRLKDRRIAIHLVNTSGNHKDAEIIEQINPVGALDVVIRCDRKPKQITLQPEGKSCRFTYENGKAKVKVDAVEIYDILIVEE